ncbi:vitamin K epoxide reductase family protein [soil metagenome]
MLVFGIIALSAAFTLSVEKVQLLENPSTTLDCSINLVLDCSRVMQTWQSHVFGFPNMYIGMIAFPIIIAIALLGLSNVRFPRWFLIGGNIGYLMGTIFSYWLFFQSVYVIEILCPWCLVVTFSTTLLLAMMTHYNLRENTFGFKKKVNTRIQAFLAKDYHKLIVASWIVLMIALVFIKFGDALFI